MYTHTYVYTVQCSATHYHSMLIFDVYSASSQYLYMMFPLPLPILKPFFPTS